MFIIFLYLEFYLHLNVTNYGIIKGDDPDDAFILFPPWHNFTN